MTSSTFTVPGRFDGKTALITGGSRGIGLGIAKAILDEGGNVVITGRKQDALEEAAAALDAGDRLRTISAHAADEEGRQAAIDLALSTYGELHHLVGNVGINPVYGPMMDVPLDAAKKIFDVNYVATLGLIQQVWRSTFAENGGSIVVVASVAGLRCADNIGVYGSSKAALVHLVTQLGVELGPKVRVNGLAPAVVKTRFAEALYAQGEEKVAASYPLKRLGVPEDIGAAAAYLLSDGAGWITGQTLICDGGLLSAGAV